jgi:hypothetical protein
MRKLTKQQAAFGSGIAITPTVTLSRFEVLAKGIPKDQWIQNEVLCVRRQLFFPLNDNENSRRMLLSLSLLLFSPFHA